MPNCPPPTRPSLSVRKPQKVDTAGARVWLATRGTATETLPHLRNPPTRNVELSSATLGTVMLSCVHKLPHAPTVKSLTPYPPSFPTLQQPDISHGHGWRGYSKKLKRQAGRARGFRHSRTAHWAHGAAPPNTTPPVLTTPPHPVGGHKRGTLGSASRAVCWVCRCVASGDERHAVGRCGGSPRRSTLRSDGKRVRQITRGKTNIQTYGRAHDKAP